MDCFDSYVGREIGNLPESRCLHKVIPILKKGDHASTDAKMIMKKDNNYNIIGFIILGGYTKGRPIEVIGYDRSVGEERITLHKDNSNNRNAIITHASSLIDSLN